jgi:ribokinase
MKPRPKIAVVGSLNIDFTFRLPRFPRPGETLTAAGMEVHLGGKGANQAVAAARAGAEVSLIGCVGADEHGRLYREHLQKEGIQTETLFSVDSPTGCAFISVDGCGDNAIVVHPGANALLSIEHIDRCAAVLTDADALLLQLECPLPVVAHAAALAKAAGVRVLLNPSPFAREAVSALRGADFWILNASEFAELQETAFPAGPAGHASLLAALACRALVVTHGGGPTVLITGEQQVSLPPPQVTPLDSVGAGDAFTGAFATFLCESQPLDACVRLANIAGALATLKPGAQPSLPDRRLIETSNW